MNTKRPAQDAIAITPGPAVTAGFASETQNAGVQEAVSTTARSRQKPGLFDLDSDAWMRGMFASVQRRDPYQSGPHKRLGTQGNGAEDVGFLGDPWARRVFAETWD